MSFSIFSTILWLYGVAICYASDTPALTYLTEHLDNYCLLSRSRPDRECRNELYNSDSSAIKQGKAGPRGPPGAPGNVDYVKMDNRIEQKLTEYGLLINKMHELEDFLQNLRKGHCQVIYNEKCFWFIDANVDYIDAHQLCSAQGGHPANIYDRIHYNMILKYVRGLREGVTEPWLGMTHEVQANQVNLFNGSRIEYRIPWHPGYPSASPEKRHMLLSIRQDWRDFRQGIWSSVPKSLEEGVICEI